MFWGLIMEPNKRYTQTVDKSFHVSMASLDLVKAGTAPIQVLLQYDGSNYLLCTLDKATTWQMPLDLNFVEGTDIAFSCNGQGNVHLTGYLTLEDDTDALDDEEDEEEEEEEEQSVQDILSSMAKGNKRKLLDMPKKEKDGKRKKPEPILSEEEEDDDLGSSVSEDDDLEIEEEEEDEEDESSENEPVKPMELNKKQKSKIQDTKNKQNMLNGAVTKQEQQQSKKQKNKKEQQNTQNEQKKRTVEGGVQIEDLKVGNGNPAKPGKFVSVYYIGRLKNGKKFDATTQGDGFKFRLGRGEVIKGWDIGVAGMKVGGKRRLTIPPAMAYGAKGSPPIIPGNSQLTFEVELKNVH